MPFKLDKMTAYSSSLWPNSPEFVGFETLHQLLEDVKKKFFLQNYKSFFNFLRLVSKYLGIFPGSCGQTIAQTTQRTVKYRNTFIPIYPDNWGGRYPTKKIFLSMMLQ